MKIVCDNCSTKYSIADEKVRGKVFKIKCKKCSHIIVVKGQEASGEAQPPGFDQKETRVFDYSGFEGKEGQREAAADAIWHLVIDREQIGPLTPAEVREKFVRGEVDQETYAWREGFGDWQRLGSIGELASAIGSQTEEAPAAAGGMFGDAGRPQDPADLFGGAGGQSEDVAAEGMFGGAGQTSGDAGVFAAAAPTPVRAEAKPAASRRAPAGDDLFGGSAQAEPAGPRMTGTRSENSVLFSLNNLSALANDNPPPSAKGSSSTASVASTPGYANNGGSEGSGLIDIRAMAAMTLGSAGRKDEPKSSGGGLDDLPVFSASAFNAPTAGVLLPTVQPQGSNKLMIGAIAAIGVLALAAIGLVIVLMTGKEKPPVVATDTPPGDRSSPPPSDQPPADKPAVAPTDKPEDKPADKPVATPTDKPADKPADKPVVATKPEKPTKPSDKPEKKPVDKPADKPVDKPADKPVATPPADKPSAKKCDEVACLVTPDLPCCPQKGGRKEPSGGNDSNLPDKLEQGDIIAGMKGVGGRVAACNDTYKVAGAFKVKITVSADGSVSAASAQAPMGGTPTGSCVEKAVKGAKFKKTKNSITFNYPYNFH
jgi:predicted Zn finger-like uncharacterized protein